ncbi:hypothetical protein LAZ67_13000836 [Cordylochernes scorpioides]|uniref:Integrase catalytic domain-containing protein n=1 Tax=Cordylochernes scorpioides TaxID=51811 RepID=A0ABY6L3C2_9ARAC|nr:hypothetical protein LAZ67_13000836 [Cordylochernes scorpioides]
MSIPSVARRGNSVLLNSEGEYIYSSDDKLIGTGNFDGNMYTLNLSRLSGATHVPNEHFLISKDNSRTAWHRRLGHPSDNKLDLILKNNLLKGLDSINGTLDQCDACPLGKMTKVPYVHTYSNQESYPFEVIYVDLCGPMRINFLGGKSKGIKHEPTTPYTPRSNGRAERANRTLLDKGRTLLADSQLPLHYWTEAVNTAAYLYNLTPTTNDLDTTPMEKWKGYSRCRRAYLVFGITARVILETADIHFRENNNVISEEKQSDDKTDTDTFSSFRRMNNLDNHVLSDADIEEPAPDTMINRHTESSGSDRPQRTRTIPKRFDDYVLATTNETIPKDYDEAIACEDKKHWENAMLEEIQNMYSHQVWELVPRLVNAKFSKTKKTKTKITKLDLLQWDTTKIPGRDYNESFSPVIKIATLRTIFSMAATKDSVIKLFDVKAAYLNGNIENTIFMEQPAGFVQDRKKFANSTKVFTVYLNPEDRVLHDCGLEKLKSDPFLFKWKNEDKYFYVGIYVDDFITVSDSEDTSNRFINKLRHHLEIKDVTCKGMFLGIKIMQDKKEISLQQSHYKYGMENCKEVPTPGSKEINLDNHIEDDNCDQHTYQEALGMLMFLAVNTRPDTLTSLANFPSRQPKQMHWTAIKRVIRYLRGTIDLGGRLESYTDASWSTTHDVKSYGGYVLKLGEATIDWKSSKQPLVALSTMEAEMIAAFESCCQIKWIINLLRELEDWNFMEKPTAIYTDSHPKQSSRCKHINRKYHFLRDCYESREICLLYKPSQDLEADIFTKDLSRDQMKKRLENLSIVGTKTAVMQYFLSRSEKEQRWRNKPAIPTKRPSNLSPTRDIYGSHDVPRDIRRPANRSLTLGASCLTTPTTQPKFPQVMEIAEQNDAKLELDSLRKHKVWTLQPLPKGSKVIKSKWIYTIKKDATTQDRKYKARLVATGYQQSYGKGYEEIFSPVIKNDSLRVILAFAAIMQNVTSNVLTLIFAADKCVFCCQNNNSLLILGIYVDDIIAIYSDEKILFNAISKINKKITVKENIGDIHFLGMDIFRDKNNNIFINQERFVNGILIKFNMQECKHALTPLDLNTNLAIFENSPKCDIKKYQEILGSLISLPNLENRGITDEFSEGTAIPSLGCRCIGVVDGPATGFSSVVLCQLLESAATGGDSPENEVPKEGDSPFPDAEIDKITALFNACLSSSNFTFQNQIFQQISGSPMGSPLFLAAAEIVLMKIDRWINRQGCLGIVKWRRYIDDIYCEFESEKEQLILDTLNSFHRTISFTIEK